jgi:outer membrane protein assembly factor BamB
VRCTTRFVALVAAAALLCSCGGAGGVSTPPSSPKASPSAPAQPNNSGDDWTTFAHDYKRTGYQSQHTGISTATASSLKLRWSKPLHEAVFSSPLVYNSRVIVATHSTGTVYALDSSTGNVVWQQTLGGQIRMTPTISDGLVYVGTHLFTTDSFGNVLPVPSALYALDFKTGSIRWKTNLPGTVRGEPVVVNGTVYEGVSGGDPPACLQGGMYALDELSGAIKWSWKVDPTSGDGGSVWSPVTYDGSHVIFGTGNTCGKTPSTVANGVVALNVDGTLAWNLVNANAVTDDDTGGGELLLDGAIIALNKNGTLYAMNASNGGLMWQKYLGAPDGTGGFGTPTTDGSTIFIATHYPGSASSGARTATKAFFRTPQTAVPSGAPQGMLYALNSQGAVLWSVQSQARYGGYVAITSGVAVADLDDHVIAFDLTSGAKLWSYAASGLINASPVIVPSGLYTVDSNGVVYAFAPSGSASQTELRR